MKNISKYKIDRTLLVPILIFAMISIVTIYSAQNLLSSNLQDLALRQTIWYIIGSGVIFFTLFIGNDFIFRNIWIFYGLGVLSLILLLLFGTPINNAKCWFSLPGIGSIQPSEFMKIILILTNASLIDNFNKEYPNPTVLEEFLFLLKIIVVVFIPSILTFLQPDTGVVLIYLIITILMLFISGIRYRWFIILFGTLAIGMGILLGIYFLNGDLFVKIFGTSFFLRIDRLLDWSNKSGYQLENGMGAIGYGGLFGVGIGNTPIYFPEPQTDFVFATYASNFGFMGSLFLLLLILFFDMRLIQTALHSRKNQNKYIIAGMLGMLLYQQFQNIGMTFGIMPITGITLPFISYGGSSLLSYMLMIGIAFNIANENMRYTN